MPDNYPYCAHGCPRMVSSGLSQSEMVRRHPPVFFHPNSMPWRPLFICFSIGTIVCPLVSWGAKGSPLLTSGIYTKRSMAIPFIWALSWHKMGKIRIAGIWEVGTAEPFCSTHEFPIISSVGPGCNKWVARMVYIQDSVYAALHLLPALWIIPVYPLVRFCKMN